MPVLRAPYFEEEVVGPARLDRLGTEAFGARDAADVLRGRLTQELEVEPDAARLPSTCRSPTRATSRIGLELVVRVDGHKRTLILPPALGDFRPSGAEFADGSLEVTFDGPGRAA